MDIYTDEVLKFLSVLHANTVEYIMVGGLAINFHGHQRYTGDIDIWLKDTLENRKRLRQAFIDCDLGDFEGLERMQFVPGWTDFHLNNGFRLDILIDMKGLENYTFDECLQMASIAEIEGVTVPFLHINQLIINKKVVNRPKDQVDVIALEKIKKLREES